MVSAHSCSGLSGSATEEVQNTISKDSNYLGLRWARVTTKFWSFAWYRGQTLIRSRAFQVGRPSRSAFLWPKSGCPTSRILCTSIRLSTTSKATLMMRLSKRSLSLHSKFPDKTHRTCVDIYSHSIWVEVYWFRDATRWYGLLTNCFAHLCYRRWYLLPIAFGGSECPSCDCHSYKRLTDLCSSAVCTSGRNPSVHPYFKDKGAF